MPEAVLLETLTTLAAKQSDLIFALLNFYGLVVLAVVGWLVNTAQKSPGLSWFRIILFNIGFLFFFTGTFGGFWYLYMQLSTTIAAWSEAMQAVGGLAPQRLQTLVWLPPQDWLWGIWPFNVVMLLLSTVVLRQGDGTR